MNPRRIIIAVVVLTLAARAPSASAAAPACATPVVRSELEISGRELSLADLLAPGACPALLLAARQVRLGAAPLVGSARVFEGSQVRALFQKVGVQRIEGTQPSGSLSGSPSESWTIPERITVRRAGPRASCADLAGRILRTLPSRPAEGLSARTVDCGAAARIPSDARLELSRPLWNPGVVAWEIAARCERPAVCVPFLVRVRENRHNLAAAGSSPTSPGGASQAADEPPLVLRGQTATLVWDQDGIRLLVPVLCLDPGSLGRPVRARILPGGRIIRAIVVSAGRLRVVS